MVLMITIFECSPCVMIVFLSRYHRVRQKCGAARCPALQGSDSTARSLEKYRVLVGETLHGGRSVDCDTSKTHRVSKIPKLPMPKAGAPAVLFARACAKVLSQKSKAKLFEWSIG